MNYLTKTIVGLMLITQSIVAQENYELPGQLCTVSKTEYNVGVCLGADRQGRPSITLNGNCTLDAFGGVAVCNRMLALPIPATFTVTETKRRKVLKSVGSEGPIETVTDEKLVNILPEKDVRNTYRLVEVQDVDTQLLSYRLLILDGAGRVRSVYPMSLQ